METSVYILNSKNEKYDITDLVVSVVIEGDYKQGARKLTCDYISSTIDKSVPIIEFNEFDHIYFYQDKKLIFMGTVYELSKNSATNNISFYAYDDGVRALKIKTSYNFNNHTITSIINSIVKYFDIPLDSFIKSDLKITDVFIGKSLYDIIMSVYTELSKVTGKKYMIEWTNDGKMRICEKGIITLDITFEEYNNLISSSYTINMDNIINNVEIIDENNNFVKEVRDEESIKQFGGFREVIRQSSGEDATDKAKSMLKGAERTCSLSGFGDYTCITGRAVTVKDSHTGLKGLFYIDSDRHTWSKGVYTIDLELNFKNIMNEMDASEKETETNSTNESDNYQSNVSVTGGTIKDAEFTAYYPSNDPMQGGYKDAMGNTLDPSKLTCAAPKEVAFNTKIQILETGTDRDLLVYKVTDRGGAINIVNGVYKIDLLMKDKTTAYAFGRRKGKVRIGVTESTSSSGISSNGSAIGDKVVSYAKSKLGCKYVWGATGPNTFDCSGLTQWSHKQCGINIPRVSGDQRKGGKLISNRSDALPGDVVCFDGHVGLYVGNGQMIHAPNPKEVVKYDNCFSGYWGNKLLAVRRYW